MELEALNKYLEVTQDHLGVEGERYGGGFRAIVAPRSDCKFLFGMLDADDIRGTETQAFFGENPLFPSAFGETPQHALSKLNEKISVLYHFEPSIDSHRWQAISRFELKAKYDADPGEPRGLYDVTWTDIVKDLRSTTTYYYEGSKAQCTDSIKRDLNALVTFKYEGEFALLTRQ